MLRDKCFSLTHGDQDFAQCISEAFFHSYIQIFNTAGCLQITKECDHGSLFYMGTVKL